MDEATGATSTEGGEPVSTDRLAALAPYIEVLWAKQGTDLHITAGAHPMLRVDGVLEGVEGAAALEPAAVDAMMTELLGDELLARFKSEGEVDFSVSWGEKARFRGNAFHSKGTTALALRMIPSRIPDFEELGLPSIISKLVHLPLGLILVTGPTGSGKSTTQASMIDYINDHRACHIITIEDPIEYIHNHKRSTVHQREVGDDSRSFDRALRACLREDPDVLLIGEMRDPESIQTALTIAETGHLVFATLHTNDSAQAIDRIVDVFPAERRPQIQVQLAHVLAAVVYQRLVRRTGGGLVAAFEIMVGNHAVRNLVREGKTRQLRNVVSTHQQDGMQTLEADLSRLIAAGVIDLDAALGVSMTPREIERPGPMVRTAPPPPPPPPASRVA